MHIFSKLVLPALVVSVLAYRAPSAPLEPEPPPAVPLQDTWTQDDVNEFRAIISALRSARSQIERAEERLVDLILARVAPPPDDRRGDTRGDKGDDAGGNNRDRDTRGDDRGGDRGDTDGDTGSDDPPKHTGNSFPGLPFAVPDIPAYDVPGLEDCDWTILDGVASSTRGLDSYAGPNPVAMAYKASVAAGHTLPITVGVWDNGGTAVPGGQWSKHNTRSISISNGQGGYLGVSLEVVGLDDSCELEIGWSRSWGHADYIGLFNIGLRGPSDSFVIRAGDGVGRLIMDGCWWLANQGVKSQGAHHASGMHVDEWGTLIWRNHKWRGLLPTDPGIDLREHSGYLKSCAGKSVEGWATIVIPEYEVGTWIIGNDLRGGNRTGFQIRPQIGNNPRPVGPIIIGYNYTDGHGWNMGSTPETFDGGSVITTWIGPESPVYVFGNTITNSKYGCFVASGQPSGVGWLNDDGFPIQSLYLYDNFFENLNGDRGCASISAVEDVHLYGGNSFQGANSDLTFDSAWGMRVNGIANGSVSIHGADVLQELKSLNILTWDPTNPSASISLPLSVLEGYLVLEQK